MPRGVIHGTADVSLVEDKEFLLSPPLQTWPRGSKKDGGPEMRAKDLMKRKTLIWGKNDLIRMSESYYD